MTAEEITFGQDVTTAVANLHRRVGQDDLLFLVTAVSVQSQTGGNLAEVLARLATLMRQRSTLQLKVKALSAKGGYQHGFPPPCHLSFMAPFDCFRGTTLAS